jgi:hypothetical protein
MILRSNHTNGVPGPFRSGLSETKKVLARLNSAHVQVNLENDTLTFPIALCRSIPGPERPFHSVRRLRRSLLCSHSASPESGACTIDGVQDGAGPLGSGFGREPQTRSEDLQPAFRLTDPNIESLPTTIRPRQ